MHRFFCPGSNITKNKIIIDDKEELHHIKDVLRLKEEDKISIFDGRGNEYIGPIQELSNKAIVVRVKEKLSSKDTGINITVACAIPKGRKMDDIVDKLTQLGVYRIIPLKTQRMIIDLDEKKEQSRHRRWEKIVISAAKQSKRKTLSVIDSIQDIRNILSNASNFDLKIIPTLSGKTRPLKDILRQNRYKDILIIIGPEGDFTPGEVNLAKRAGCIPVSLGKLVLRVDTAAIAVTSFIRLYENS